MASLKHPSSQNVCTAMCECRTCADHCIVECIRCYECITYGIPCIVDCVFVNACHTEFPASWNVCTCECRPRGISSLHRGVCVVVSWHAWMEFSSSRNACLWHVVLNMCCECMRIEFLHHGMSLCVNVGHMKFLLYIVECVYCVVVSDTYWIPSVVECMLWIHVILNSQHDGMYVVNACWVSVSTGEGW